LNFFCTTAFDCPTTLAKLEDTLVGLTDVTRWQGFVPISPVRTNVKSSHFYITPVEDPRKAFAETDPAMGIQQQPHVTVTMTLTPAQSEAGNFGGGLPIITLQSTFSSRVYNEVKSYSGKGLCFSYS